MEKSDLQKLWQPGKGKAVCIDNVEELVEQLLLRETEKLIKENKHLANKRKPPTLIDDGLDEIEMLEELDDNQGLQFYGSKPKPKPNLAPVSSKPFTLGSVNPIGLNDS